MKLKSSWIVFIPAFLIVMGIQLFQSASQTGFFETSIAALSVVGLMLLGVTIIVCADKFAVRDYMPRKNVFSGVMLCLSAVFAAFYGVTGLPSAVEGDIDILGVALSVAAMLSAVVFILLGINTLTGNFTITAAPVMALAPVLMFVLELVKRFVMYTKEAVASAEMYDILYVAFMLIFFFYCASIYAGIPTKYAVKCCFIFGMPAITLTFVWCIKEFFPVINGTEAFGFNNMLPEFTGLSVSLFALSFLLEMTLNSRLSKGYIDEIDTDDYDFSEEEEYFGAIKHRPSTSKPSYEGMVSYATNKQAQSQESADPHSEERLNNKSEKDQENEFVTDGKPEAEQQPDEDGYVPASQQSSSDDAFDNDEDLSWIDKLIKDIEEEQKNNN